MSDTEYIPSFGIMAAGILLGSLLLYRPALAAQQDVGTSPANAANSGEIITTPTLNVLTLNLAHGRKKAFNQMFQRTRTTRANLLDIANFLGDSGADVVALQEADLPSRWSGKFDHVDYLSDNSPFPHRAHASHAQKFMYDFGTALLSRVPFSDTSKHTFAPSPPTTNKGFVMGQVRWNPGGRLPQAITVSVISVHLDFSRKKVRVSQVQELQDMLTDISPPLIILGDFNTDWSKDESALRTIVSGGNLKVHQPGSTDLGTYKSGKHRLDWILISKDLEFVRYEVPQVSLSDHQPVLASVKLLENRSSGGDSNAADIIIDSL